MMENNENKGNEIARGHINTVILKALSEGEKYGYEIGKYIESKSNGEYILKQPTLYSSLKRLEDKGVITSYWGDDKITGGGRRKYFKLTEIGEEICSKNLEEWNQSRKIIDKLITDKSKENSGQNTGNNGKQLFPENNNSLNINPQTQDTKININKMENNVFKDERNANFIEFPKITRQQQLFSNENIRNENEYKSIISKLLSNVKDEMDNAVNFKDNNNDINLEKALIEKGITEAKITENNLPKQETGFEQKEFDLKRFENNPNLNDIKIKDENNFSLLPSSSQYTFTNFTKLQKEMQEQGFNLRSHTNTEKQEKQFLLVNKINFISLLILYFFMLAETAVIYKLWEPLIEIGIVYYAYAAGILFFIPLLGTLNYIFYPNKKTKKRYYISNSVISALMFFMVTILGITAIALLFNVDTKNTKDMIVKIFIPGIYAFNFILYPIIWGTLYKTKICYI